MIKQEKKNHDASLSACMEQEKKNHGARLATCMEQEKKNHDARLAACMERAQRGEELTIGFFGGSITQGSLASEEAFTYAHRVFQWWENTFPQARMYAVNGGIGGTCSCFGGARAERDLLMYQPDVVVVDFSVNDAAEVFYQETYEGLLRRIMNVSSHPAVLILNNVYYDCGKSAQDLHNAVAAHYGLPWVSIRDSIYQEMKQGKYHQEELTPDGLHPNNHGHMLVAKEIIRLLEAINAKRKAGEYAAELEEIFKERQNGTFFLPQPLTDNAYEHSVLLNIQNSQPLLQGFRADTREKMGHLDGFKQGWIGKTIGDSVRFSVDCSCIAVQYRKTVQRPAVSARLVLDGKQEEAVLLDGKFEETWGDCLYLQPILHHGEKKTHEVEIEIIEAGKEGEMPFYLLGLITA